jgi:hypothetical protein
MKPPSMTRFSLSEAQNHRCCYCSCEMTLEDNDSATMATREHLIPRVFGGPTEWWNLVAACHECNSLRGHMNALAFHFMRQTMSHERLMQTFDRYERSAAGKVIIVFVFLRRLFGHPPAMPVVTLKRQSATL